jgi:hypothetical protein
MDAARVAADQLGFDAQLEGEESAYIDSVED